MYIDEDCIKQALCSPSVNSSKSSAFQPCPPTVPRKKRRLQSGNDIMATALDVLKDIKNEMKMDKSSCNDKENELMVFGSSKSSIIASPSFCLSNNTNNKPIPTTDDLLFKDKEMEIYNFASYLLGLKNVDGIKVQSVVKLILSGWHDYNKKVHIYGLIQFVQSKKMEAEQMLNLMNVDLESMK